MSNNGNKMSEHELKNNAEFELRMQYKLIPENKQTGQSGATKKIIFDYDAET